MVKEFMWIKPDGTWSTRRSIGEVMEKAKEQMPFGLRPYSLTKDGERIRRGARTWVLRGLRRELENGKPGNTYRLRGHGDILFVAREVVPAVHIIDTNGNDKADKCWSYGKAEYPDCSFLGAYVCKHIAGSYTMSQHSYGNAVDFGRNSMDELYDLAYYLVGKADELSTQHVIVDNRIWTRGFGWSYYGGQRHYHVHADFTPQYSGSCGVRG
jgi:hypothetical protein